MTTPINWVLDGPVVDYDDFCCTDPGRGGGCGHPLSTHTSGSACRVFGCNCQQLRKHKLGCWHKPIPDEEASA